MKSLTVFLILFFVTLSSFGNDAFPTTRRTGLTGGIWQDAGVPGGIPTGQTVYTNVPVLSASDLNTVVNVNCPSNQVVVLTNGPDIYDLGNNAFRITKNGVVVRGATNSVGFPTTVISNGAFWIGSKGGSPAWPSENWAAVTAININSGLSSGSTSITLASAPGADFVVGEIFMIDQTDDGTLVKASTVALGRRTGRSYNIMLQITNISGNTIEFQPPLVGGYWDTAARTPQAVGWANQAGVSDTYKMIGLENVIIVPDGDLYNSGIGVSYGCWMKNVKTTGWPTTGGSAGVHLRHVVNCEVTMSILADQGGLVNSSAYAVYPVGFYFSAIENNIFTNLPLAIPMANAVGSSISYNYFTGQNYYNNPSTHNPEYVFPHGGHSFMCLIEGNWMPSPIDLDQVFTGNNDLFGITRNRLIGWSTGKTSGNDAFIFEADQDTNTVLGNIMGMEGYHTTYASTFSIDASCNGTVMTNNYNVGDDGVNSSETMSSDTMLNSYRFTTSPVWWGNLQWPSFPVSSISTNTLYYTNMPAGFRSYFGQWPSGIQGGPGTSGNKRPIKGIKLKGIRR